MQELNRFVHFYTRFKNHENSYKLEVPLLNTAKEKMMKLAEAVTDHASAKLETKFVEDAVHQLLKARCVLKCSYVYAYYLDGPGYKKIVFECMQTELEECTEILSQIVNRLYLRTPRRRIIEQAHIVQRKRHEFIAAIVKGLVPPETPPAMRKRKRKKYSIDLEDEELRKAILASIQEVDPANPWIKDASGRHTNVMAVLDWPDSDSDSSEADTTGTSLKSIDGLPEVFLDEQMELLRALEMSRLQYMRETGLLNIPQANSEIDINSLDAPNPGFNESHDTNMSEPLTTNQTDQNSSTEFSHQLQTMLSNILNEAVEQIQSNSSDVWVKRDLSKIENVEPATVPVKCSSSNENILSRSCNSKMSLQSEIATEELEQLGAYAGAQIKPLPISPPSTNCCFGIIKDLSVTNILATDEDKTNSFLNKDFSFGIKKNEFGTKYEDASISLSNSKSFDNSTELNQSLDISANNCLKKVEMTADCIDGGSEKPKGKSNFVEKAQNTVKHFDTDCVSLLEISQNLLYMSESLFENSEQDIAVDISTESPREANISKSPETSPRDLIVNDLNTVRNGNDDQADEGYVNQIASSCDPAVSQQLTTRPNDTTKDHNEESNGQYFSV